MLPTSSKKRKSIPIVRGLLDYFPAACAAVAEVSRLGNEKHNPGEEMHHARGKSTDHADCIVRHLMDRGTIDGEDGTRHSAKVAWRALALLQQELEDAGEADLARGARLPEGATFHPSIHSRIAGQTDAEAAIKNFYYNADPWEIVGICSGCSTFLKARTGYLKENGRYYCSLACLPNTKGVTL